MALEEPKVATRIFSPTCNTSCLHLSPAKEARAGGNAGTGDEQPWATQLPGEDCPLRCHRDQFNEASLRSSGHVWKRKQLKLHGKSMQEWK